MYGPWDATRFKLEPSYVPDATVDNLDLLYSVEDTETGTKQSRDPVFTGQVTGPDSAAYLAVELEITDSQSTVSSRHTATDALGYIDFRPENLDDGPEGP